MSGDKNATRRFSLDSSGYTPDSGGLLAKAKSSRMRRSSEGMKVRALEEEHLALLELNRSLQKTSPTRTSTIEEEGGDQVDGHSNRNSFKNHNKTFHKHFPEISETDDLNHAFSCALQKEVLYQGKMYVSDQHVCFYSSVLLKETKVMIQVSTIQEIKKKNTARVVPNAIAIISKTGEKYLFVSIRNRDSCFQLLQSVCPQLQTVSASGSPQISSAENGCEVDTISSHSSQEEHVDMQKVSLLEQDRALSFSSPSISHGQARSSSTPQSSASREGHSSEDEGPAVSWVTMVTERIKSVLSMSSTTNINHLLIVYLILVVLLLLSSGYIGLRIVALEEQLNTLGSMSEFNLQKEYKET